MFLIDIEHVFFAAYFVIIPVPYEGKIYNAFYNIQINTILKG